VKAKISRMSYANFEDSITEKYGVVLENWPLQMFCSPSNVKSHNEVKVLYQAWESRATWFCQMSNDEWKDWQETWFQRNLEKMNGTADPGNDNMTDVGNAADPGNDNAMHVGNAADPGNDNAMHVGNTADPGNNNVTTGNNVNTVAEDAGHPGDDAKPSMQMVIRASQRVPLKSVGQGHGKKSRPGPLVEFINTSTVTSLDGQTLVIGKKPHKERSDKGMKTEPRGSGKLRRGRAVTQGS
jgi:hypothetical protein